MPQTIGFIGNCQMGTLCGLYRRLVGSDAGIEVFYIPSYEQVDPQQQEKIAEADILVRQILDFDQKIGTLETNATVFLFPHVTGAFLWPYGGQPHPLNRKFPYFDPSGPYPTELGDSFLNRMLSAGVDPDIAAQRYLDTDVATEKNLDRLKELILDRQRSRDRACGYNFADFIEANFRTDSLFRSPNHPEIPMTMVMATQLFERLGVDAEVIAEAAANPPDGLFPTTETPIHPSVVAKFGLTFAPRDRRYRYFEEGNYTFEEYVGRYMRFEWDPALAEGMHWFRAGKHDKAAALLERGIGSCARSAVARYVLSDLLVKQARIAEGTRRAKEAFDLEPKNPHYEERYKYFTSILPPVKTPEPMLGPRLEIQFGCTGNAHKYQDEGWSLSESDYTWTSGRRASLQIGKAPIASGYIMTFTASPFTPRAQPFQRCAILMNGIQVADFCLEKAEEHSIWIPSDLESEISDRLVITFELPDAARPADFEGEISDQRMLGLAFQTMTLDRLSAA